jgi:transcription termination/antitermination protein NusA
VAELGESIIQKLVTAGITTVEALADMTPEQLEEIPGIGEKTLEKISIAVRHYFGHFEEGEEGHVPEGAEGASEKAAPEVAEGSAEAELENAAEVLEEAESTRAPLAEEELTGAGTVDESVAEGLAEDLEVTATELAVENVPAADAEENETDTEEEEKPAGESAE